MPDPKCIEAMEEIKAVLTKHDLAGVILLQSATHGEFLYELSPSWSCARLVDGGIRVRSKLVDYPSAEAQKKSQEETVGMLAGFVDMLASAEDDLFKVVRMLSTRVDFSHFTRRESQEERE